MSNVRKLLGPGATLVLLLGLGQPSDAKPPPKLPTFKSAEAAAIHTAKRVTVARYGAFRDIYAVGFKVADWSVTQAKPYRYRKTFNPAQVHCKLWTREYQTPRSCYIQVAKADLWVEQIKTGPAAGRWRALLTKPAKVEQGGYNGDFQPPW